MGNFYTNFVVFNTTQDCALTVMRELKREGYVTPSISKAVTIYDAGSEKQDIDTIESLGNDLSEKLRLPVLAVMNSDDDYLIFWIFQGNQRLSRYFFILQAASFGFSLSRIKGGPLAFLPVLAILAWPFFTFQITRHEILAKILKLPICSVGFGFEYISDGEIPDGISENDLVRI